MSDYVLGFDFGTSNCSVAMFNAKSGKNEILPISNYIDIKKKKLANQGLFPSRVGVDEDLIFKFGGETVNCERDNVWDNSKRLIEHDTPIYRAGHYKKPIWATIGIMTGVANQIKELDINIKSNTVITVPANSYSTQRSLTRLAAEAVGFQVNQLVSEPCAAALGCNEFIKNKKYILVVDIGGGTTDIALLDNDYGTLRELSVKGIKRLGGLNIDKNLFDKYKQEFETLSDSEQLLLKDLLEDCKIDLSTNKSTKLFFKDQTIEIKRDEIEEIISDDLIELEGAIDNVISQAGLTHKEVNAVLPIGGTSNIPAIRKLLENLFKTRLVKLSFDDSITAVAKGAAIAAAIEKNLISDLKFKQCLEHSVGLRVWKSTRDNKVFSAILRKGEEFPASNIRTYASDTKTANIVLYESTSEKLNKSDTKLIVETHMQSGNIHVDVEVTYDDDGKIDIKTYKVNKDDFEKVGDLGDVESSKAYLEKLKKETRKKGIELKIDSIEYIDPSLDKIALREFANEFKSKSRFKKMKEEVTKRFKSKSNATIETDEDNFFTEEVEIKKIKEAGEKPHPTLAFVHLTNGIIKKCLQQIFLDAGIKTTRDIDALNLDLKNQSDAWEKNVKRLPDRPFEDYRFLIKVLQFSRYISSFKHLRDRAIQNQLNDFRNLLNDYPHGFKNLFDEETANENPALHTDSLDHVDAQLEKELLDEIAETADYSDADVLRVGNMFIQTMNLILSTNNYVGSTKKYLLLYRDLAYSLLISFED